jgi:peptidylprolyl isomerase
MKTKMIRMLMTACLAALSTPAFADALEGKKSGAEILGETTAEDWRTIPAEDTLVVELESGKVTIALVPSLAPMHVAQVRKLARQKFYDGLSFYRVIDGFVAQGGDPFGERKIGNAKKSLKAEFDRSGDDVGFKALADVDGFAPAIGFVGSLPAGHDAATGASWLLHCPGAFALGREDGRDTASTEFYVALGAQRYLDRNMSVIGRVIDGMRHLQALRRVEPPESKEDDVGEKIVTIRVAADIPEAERETWEILDSARPAFEAYAEARRNRPEAFFHFRAGHLDICQMPVPVRRKGAA